MRSLSTCTSVRHGNHATFVSKHKKEAHCICDCKEPLKDDKNLANIAVFLGGSCNPTTWRHDVAMPMLDAVHVPYYNPQVDEWFEELIEIETKAKEEAQLVLFVVDQLTRCLVSINEAVEFICRGRKVLLVVDNIKNGHDIEGKVLSPTELADLNGARQCLRDLRLRKT